MDPRQIDLARASLTALAGREMELAESLYEHLFRLDPTTRQLFTGDAAEQRRRVMAELDVLIDLLENLDQFVERSKELGRRHAGYGVEPHHYATMLEAHLAAFTEVLGDEFTDEAAIAWRRAFNLVAETMMMGARW